MDLQKVFHEYDLFIESSLTNRFFKHADIVRLLEKLPVDFKVTQLGNSVEGRSVNMITWGNGPVKIMLWSQMHGDEPTGTMAIFDLCNFLQHADNNAFAGFLKASCTLYIIPMVNPDGAEGFTRRNSQQIDINRDYLLTNSPEGRILRNARAAIQPDFGLNLHDQVTLWSVTGHPNPATISYLAPAANEALEDTPSRFAAKRVIADMFTDINSFIPGHIGLFDETYEPRAFGDNFQKAGTATILIEAGGFEKDYEKQTIRKYFFLSILSGIRSICEHNFLDQDITNYHNIPDNGKKYYHLILKNVRVNGVDASLALNYEEEINAERNGCTKYWRLHDLGDLTGWHAYRIVETRCEIQESLIMDELANFDVLSGGEIILSFKNGILVHSGLNSN